MMRLTIVAVGRHKTGPLKALQEFYAERIRWPLTIREVEERRKLPPAELKAREGELILGALPKDAELIALDGRGKTLSSTDLANRLARWRDADASLAFAIGGADGLADTVLDQGQAGAVARRDDLAAPSGPRHAAGAALSGAANPRRPSLSPGIGHRE